MNDNFLLLFLNIELLLDYDRVNLGAGISLDGISMDGGQTWYLIYQNQVILEEDFITGMHCLNMSGCTARIPNAVRLE